MKPQVKMAVSMSILGSVGVLTKSIPTSPAFIAFSRGLVGAATLLLFAGISGNRIHLQSLLKKRWALLASGIALGANWLLAFTSYRYADVSICTLCMYVYPVFLMLMLAGLGRERLTAKGLLMLACALAGTVLCSGITSSQLSFQNNWLGVVLSLGAAAFCGLVVLINKELTDVDTVSATIFQLFVASVCMLAYLLCSNHFPREPLSIRPSLLLLLLGVLHTGAAYWLHFSALKDLSGTSAALMSYIDPLVAVVLSIVLLGESLDVLQFFGAVLILGTAIISQLFEKKKLYS